MCATCAGLNLGVLAFKISNLCKGLVLICAIRAGAILSVLAGKSSILRQKTVIIIHSYGSKFWRFSLRQKLVIICASCAGANLGV